ncbi:nocturnin isoform X2 [Anas acuta]|uniref:nocturnin isoform X2 n=1 Tax=Anas acuta TaxID=28680 RepID=UPI0035C9024D
MYQGPARCLCPLLRRAATASTAPPPPRAGCPMGGGGSRLYGALAQTLSSSTGSSGTGSSAAAAAAPRERRGQPEAEPEPLEARELLAQCRLVLRRRPPRCRRRFVDLRQGAAGGPRPIRVMQWNILAQALGEGKDNFVQCPMEALKWEERKCLILEEILAYQPDILCLQEVDHYFDTFQPLLSRLGYQGTFFPKPWSPCLDVERNNGPDGCALFFLKDRFELINSANIRLTAMKLKTNQVAIAQTLKCHETGRLFCIAVTHLKARTGWERFRSAQGCDLLQNLKSITQGAKIPLIVCGDFNAEPTEEVYREFSNSSLNLNSAYKLLSPDGQSEPPYTTWKIRPSGECRHTLDYIWYSQHALNVNSALGLLTEEQIGPNRLPSFNYPSDHMSLVCDFSFNQDPDRLL